MSKPVNDDVPVTEGTPVTFPNTTSAQRSRPKAACVSASCSDRQTVPSEGSADDTPTTGKRFSAYPMQRRGSRKKTLSLNPEEREALENLIEEVIMGGVGEGVIDSDATSSDEDPDAEDEQSPSSQNSLTNSSTAVAVGDASKQDAFVKGGKKFYPGQLKVALKHMHDLPPRFVRKLAKAQQYLDAGGNMYSKPAVGRIEEEEETQSKDDSKQPKLAAEAAAMSVPERDRDKTRLKENRLKDAKKMIRTLLTDRDQYVDETASGAAVSGQSQSASSDGVYSTAVSSNQNPHSFVQYHPHDTASQQVVLNNAAPICRSTMSANAASFSTIVTCTSETHVYRPCMLNSMAEHVQKTSDVNYRTAQSSNPSASGPRPIPAQPFQPPSLGIPQYQFNVPMVHGMKPAPVLSQSPPGTQFWMPEAVVPSNAPGFYGSSPPVVGMTWLPSAFNQPVPYAHSIQSSYPTVQGVHASYTPQYMYSASPPSQGMVGQPYSAAGFSQPVSYPLSMLHPEQHYVRPPNAMSANFFQNTPPPGYCPTQSRPACDQRQMFAGDVPQPVDGTRKQIISVDHIHKLSALSGPVVACHQSPTQPVNYSIDTRSEHAKPVCTASAGVSTSHNHETSQKCSPVFHPSTRHGGGYQSVDTGAKMMPNVRCHAQQSSPDLVSAVSSHKPRFSKSPVTVPLPNPCTLTSTSIPNSMLNSCAAAQSQGLGAAHEAVSEVCVDSAVIHKTTSTLTVKHSDTVTGLSSAYSEASKPHCTSPSSFSSPMLNTNVLSNSLSAESGSGDDSTGHCETAAGSSEVLEQGSATAVVTQESNTRIVAEEQSDIPYTSIKSLSQTVDDLHISGKAVMLSVNENSDGADIVSNDTKGATQLTCLSRTGNYSGEPVTHTEQREVIAAQSELQSGLKRMSESEAENLNRSSDDQSQLLNPTSCFESPPASTDEVADISLDCDATAAVKTDSSSSDLVVTLGSRLTSALADMFGQPAERDAHYGMPITC